MKSVILLLVLIFSISNIISAQTIQSEISDLAKGADVILTGTVINKKSDWNTRKSAIYTRVTIQVDEYLKGNISQNTITVIHPGGEVDDTGELYTHIPTFSSDENVLLFANKSSNNTDYYVHEGEMGKVTLYMNDHGEQVTAQKRNVSVLKAEIKKSLSEE
jgi:hypothetical protein